MFKKSSDQQNFVARTGSHATKESRTGRIDAIPAWAQEPEQYYNSLRDRWRSVLDQYIDAQNKLAEINEKLRHTLPHREFEHLKQHKERLAARATILQQQQGEYRPLVRAAGERAWSHVFFYVARKLLTPEDFALLMKETDELLGRPCFEIKAGEGELVGEARIHNRTVSQRQKRRANWRKHKGGSVTVWADNRPVKQQYIDENKTGDK